MSDQKKVMLDMLANAVHFGHRTSKWNPKVAPYLFGKRNGVHVFDLNQTYQALMEAKEFLKTVGQNGRTILFVSTKPQGTDLIKQVAERCKMPYVTSKWIPGLLTNFKTIRSRVKYMLDLKAERENGGFDKYTKKEVVGFNKQIEKLEDALGGVAHLERLPDAVFVLDCHRDVIAVQEARKMKVTVVGVVDSNADPDGIQYVIPGNDDAIKSISYLINELADALHEGQKSRK